MSECRCRALTLSLSQACFWAPKMRPILVTKTRPRSLQQTLKLQIWDPNSGTNKRSVAGHKLPLLGPRLARRDNLKFLRLTLPFVFSKLLACALSHTHGGSAMARPEIAPFLAPETMVNTVVMLHHGCRCRRPTPRTNAQARKCTKLRQVSSNRAKDVSRM